MKTALIVIDIAIILFLISLIWHRVRQHMDEVELTAIAARLDEKYVSDSPIFDLDLD